jgi:hypothetical protein
LNADTCPIFKLRVRNIMLQRMGIINAEALFSFSRQSNRKPAPYSCVDPALQPKCGLAVIAVIYLYSLLSENLSQYVTVTSINADCARH